MRVGILGGGQLAKMMAQAGQPLGIMFKFVSPDADSCAAPFGELICADYTDENALKQLAAWSDVITCDIESIPPSVTRNVETQATLYPASHVFEIARDRLFEKSMFRDLGISTVKFEDVHSQESLNAAVEKLGLPAILKTRTEGYDGKGQIFLREPQQVQTAWQDIGEVPCILEAVAPFTREVSIIAARNTQGESVFYPLTENHHRDGILRLSLPLQHDPFQQAAQQMISKLLEKFNYVGVLTLELFQVGDELYANEIAPRVHNSGHWTIEGAVTSQFENHVRAINGMPLGDTSLVAPSAMINFIGTVPTQDLTHQSTYTHLYGKAARAGRKLGHATVVQQGDDTQAFTTQINNVLSAADEEDLMRK